MTAITKTKTKERTRCLEERQQKRWRMVGPRETKGKIKTKIKIKNSKGTLQDEILRNPGKRRNQRQVLTVQETGVTAVVVIRRIVMERGVRSSLQSGLDLTIIELLEERRNAEKCSYLFIYLYFTHLLHSSFVSFSALKYCNISVPDIVMNHCVIYFLLFSLEYALFIELFLIRTAWEYGND
jgi:hypothetical protein